LLVVALLDLLSLVVAPPPLVGPLWAEESLDLLTGEALLDGVVTTLVAVSTIEIVVLSA
jgi:hypothetical protein